MMLLFFSRILTANNSTSSGFSADANAEIFAETAAISGIIGRYPPLRTIVFVKVEPSTEFLILFVNNYTCSRFKNLV